VKCSHVKPYEPGRRRSEPVTGGDTKWFYLERHSEPYNRGRIHVHHPVTRMRRECRSFGEPFGCIEGFTLCA
jgi:hypothetical protein